MTPARFAELLALIEQAYATADKKCAIVINSRPAVDEAKLVEALNAEQAKRKRALRRESTVEPRVQEGWRYARPHKRRKR